MTGTDLETATGVTPMVAVRGVHKFFGDLHVLRGIDLDIAAGEVCVILGPSGSGKSTLLRCLNMLEDISAGRVYVDGHLLGYRVDSKGVLHERRDRVIAAQRSHIGMVFGAPLLADPHEHVGIEELAGQVTRERGDNRAPHDAQNRRKGLLVLVVGGRRQVLDDEEGERGQERGHEAHDDDPPRAGKTIHLREHVTDDVGQREENCAPIENQIMGGRTHHKSLRRGDIRNKEQRDERDRNDVEGARGARRSRRDRAI